MAKRERVWKLSLIKVKELKRKDTYRHQECHSCGKSLGLNVVIITYWSIGVLFG